MTKYKGYESIIEVKLINGIVKLKIQDFIGSPRGRCLMEINTVFCNVAN